MDVRAGIAAQQGLVNGLSGNLKAVDAAIKKVTDRMTSQVKKNLGIHSPSRVFRYEVGRQVPAGLALGVRDGTGWCPVLWIPWCRSPAPSLPSPTGQPPTCPLLEVTDGGPMGGPP
ncbi:phage tail protein [Arthrobacter woluwensis]|uniref:phage tail protein n=1 Tax=Arthrobacter woluwensis TaxID=156980 RepID=UPI000943E4EE|nr:hypothetical protein [Arthrobacter woluwensis]